MINRRKLLQTGAFGVITGCGGTVAGASVGKLTTTPRQTEGPFYPDSFPPDNDFDLTVIKGSSMEAAGEKIWVEGQVVDSNDQPVSGARVEIWQANSVGRYSNSNDTSSLPLDPNFQGWGIVPSGVNGGFRFKTVFPGAYRLSGSNWRTPHIHFKISHRSFGELITQMYFPGQKLNGRDSLLQSESVPGQRLLIATEKGTSNNETEYSWRVIVPA